MLYLVPHYTPLHIQVAYNSPRLGITGKFRKWFKVRINIVSVQMTHYAITEITGFTLFLKLFT